MKVIFEKSYHESENIVTFFFKSERLVQYTAGQFIELTVPHHKPDDRGIKRWFTLSSSPQQELLSITTKFAPKSSSYKVALLRLEPGTELNMSDPMGDFVMPKLTQTPLVFVAGGIGVTPFHSMFEWLADTNETRPIKFLYSVKSEDEIVFQGSFDRSGIKPTIIVSNPSDAWGGERGHLTAEQIIGLEHPTDDTLIYISGPEAMVESLIKDLQKTGIKKHQIVGDYFPNYSEI
jgi:ferredoxin-NADP reductase